MTEVAEVLSRMTAIAAEKTPGSRGLLCDQFVEMLNVMDEEPTDKEWRIITDIYELIVRDVEKVVRAKFASELERQNRAPRELIRMLCNDEVDVARHLLVRSRSLLDEDLIEIVESRTTDHRVLVASRNGLSEQVSAAIVTTGDVTAVKSLLENVTARIGEDSFIRISEFCASTTDLHEPLVNRPDVPWKAVEKIISLVSKALLTTISEKWDIPKSELMEIALQAEEEASDELADRRARYRVGAGEFVWPTDDDSWYGRGEPGKVEFQIIDALNAGDRKTAIRLLHDWTGLPTIIVRTILEQEDLRLLATIFKAKSVDQLTFSRAAVAVLGQRPEDDQGRLRKLMDFYRGLDETKALTLIKKWRTDPRAFNKARAVH